MILAAIAATAAFVPAPASAQSSAKASQSVVLGKLGQATKATPIFTSPNSKARIYYTAKPKEYLVLRKMSTQAWMQVLMQNGQHGYVATAAVKQLPYEVTSEKPAARPRAGMLASRGSKRSIASAEAAAAVANYSLNYLGTPYVWGGNDPNKGIDCSGFVKKMYGAIGASLPRTAAEQATVGTPINRLEDLQKGDRLYFWDKKRGKIGHTGIYMGDGTFVHSSSGRGGVATDYLGSPKWLRILVAARR